MKLSPKNSNVKAYGTHESIVNNQNIGGYQSLGKPTQVADCIIRPTKLVDEENKLGIFNLFKEIKEFLQE